MPANRAEHVDHIISVTSQELVARFAIVDMSDNNWRHECSVGRIEYVCQIVR